MTRKVTAKNKCMSSLNKTSVFVFYFIYFFEDYEDTVFYDKYH